MEIINGCTVIVAASAADPARLGPDEMSGAYVVLAGEFPPGEPGPPLHVHPTTDELFYVGDGEATFVLGDREVQVGGGGLVFVPRGMPHTVRNSGAGPIRGMLVISPGDVEHEFVPVDQG